MKQMVTNCALTVLALALLLGVYGCSQKAVPIEEKDVTRETQAISETKHDAIQPEKVKRVLTPAKMGFPPEQPAPWVMTVSPEPLSPVTTANTGDFRGTWPEYFAPREIRITAPELPPGIEGATLSAAEASLSPYR